MNQTLISVSLLAQDAGSSAIPAWQWWVTGGLVVATVAGLVVLTMSTRTGVIARATTKEAIRQPVFIMLLLISSLLIAVNTILPFFSLGEDFKMLKDCGLATILISGLLLAVWTSGTSIANEIEGKTAMTLLSKPITRRQFVLGKFIGILQGVLALIVPLMILLSYFIFYKVGYDAKESGEGLLEWSDPRRMREVLHVLPGFALIFLEIGVLAAVSVAIATRAPMVVNIVSCLAIFVVGHLTPMLVKSGVLQFEIVEFMARLIATVLPNLDYFNMSAAVATGEIIPPAYLLACLGYSVVYGGAAVLVSFVLFEDRDLA